MAEGGAPACPACQPQETAATAEEGEGEEEPPVEMRTPARAGGEAPGGERTASAYDRPGVTAPTTEKGGGLAVAGGTEVPEGAFTSVDPWSAAPGPTTGGGEKRRRFATSTAREW